MIPFLVSTLTLFAVLFLLSFPLFGKSVKKDMERKHLLHILYPMSEAVLFIANKIIQMKEKNETDEVYRSLFIGMNAKNVKVQRNRKMAATALLVFLAALILSLWICMVDKGTGHISNGTILRPEYGDDSLILGLSWKLQEKELNMPGNGEVLVTIVPQRLTDSEQINALFQQAEQYIDVNIFKNKDNCETVTQGLILFEHITSMDIDVQWTISDTEWLYPDGSIRNKDIPAEGVLEDITAEMTYYGNICIYQFTVRLMPVSETLSEQFQSELKEYLDSSFSDNSVKEITLPSKIAGEAIIWEEKETNRGMMVFLLGIIFIVFLIAKEKNELQKLSKKREKELSFGYSSLISKFLLLLGAGMTIRGAFERITSEYEKCEKTEGYLYKEMKVTKNELLHGISEVKAYEAFGRRCGMISYLRFGTILVQNISRGAKGTLPILELEAKEAFDDRKELAKRLGEESATKLLVPMMGMLFIVLIIIMMPALWTF